VSPFALVIAGQSVPVPGVTDGATWLTDPRRAPPITDGKSRDPSKVLAFVFHTSRGRRGVVREGSRPSERAELLARYQARTERDVSWHLTIDTDGSTLQQADLVAWMAWHVEAANGWTIGCEMIQHPDTGDLWRAQIDAAVAVCIATCEARGIPKRVLVGPDGRPWVKPVPALLMRKYGGPGASWGGVLGHCHLVPDTVRGPGDPGAGIFEALLAAGFEGVDVTTLGHVEAPAAPSRAPLPDWLDPTREVVDTGERDIEPDAFVRDALANLVGLGVPRERALEVVAHCAVESGFGRHAAGNNLGGVKLSQTDNRLERHRTGRGLPWWRRAGHVNSGDDAVCYYRAFADAAAFWAFWLARYVPRDASVAQRDRYVETGRRFWNGGDWFVAMLAAGYRGPVRQREIIELLAHGDPETHPSVAEHRAVVERVRDLAGPTST